MGGSALKVPVRRLSAAEHHPLAHTLSREIARISGARVEPIPAYSNKSDFGDIDLLIEREALDRFGRDNLKNWLRANLNTRQIYESKPDSPSLSFDYRQAPTDDVGIQVDLITTRHAAFDTARDYYSYNDLGGLIGVLTHAMGFSYTPDGLMYKVADKTRRIGVVPVTDATAAILVFLGLDPVVFSGGFHELEQIFGYVSTSPYFNPDFYLPDNRSHAARARDKKRSTHQRFLGWLNANQDKRGAYPWCNKAAAAADFVSQRAVFVEKARTCFPGFAARLDALFAEDAVRINLQARFNANKVSEWTGARGPVLGQLMKTLRDAWPNDKAMAAWIETRNDAQVAEWVKQKVGASIFAKCSPVSP